MLSFSPNLPVTAVCKFQAPSFHICHPPCHQRLTRWSLGFQIWPGITLRQPSMVDSSCIYHIVSQRQEICGGNCQGISCKELWVIGAFLTCTGTKIQVIPNTDKPLSILCDLSGSGFFISSPSLFSPDHYRVMWWVASRRLWSYGET